MMFSLVFLATKPPVNFELLQGPDLVFAPDQLSRQPALHHPGRAHEQEDVRARAPYMGLRLGS